MRTTRADWANSCPWGGIVGKPTVLEDAAALAAKVAALEARVVELAGTLTSVVQVGLQAETFDVQWTIGRLEPLQAISDVFSRPGLTRSIPMVAVAKADNLWLTLYASSFQDGTFRLVAQNTGPYWIEPGTITVAVTYFINA